MKRNKFSKALKHLKSKKIDEKIKSLEEAAPTNSMSGVYQVTPSTGDAFRMGELDPAKKFYPKADGTWPAGIPADPSDRVYVRGAGYHTGKGAIPDSQNNTPRDLSLAYMNANGNDTTTMIRASDGAVYADLPEGTRNFILGPLVTSYTQNHTSDDFTNLGYIQKDTRQFVLLGRIEGFLDGAKRLNGAARTWDGTATQFISYNSNFTIEHALWMRDRYNEGNFTANVPFNLSGGIPADRHPDDPTKGGGDVLGTDGGPAGSDSDDDGKNQDPADENDIESLDLWGLIKGIIGEIGDRFAGVQGILDAIPPFLNFLAHQLNENSPWTDDNPFPVKLNEQEADAVRNDIEEIFNEWGNDRVDEINEGSPMTPEEQNQVNEKINRNKDDRGSDALDAEYPGFRLTMNNIGKPNAFEGNIQTNSDGTKTPTAIDDNYVFEGDADASAPGAPAIIKFMLELPGVQSAIEKSGLDYPYRKDNESPIDDFGTKEEIKNKNMPIKLNLTTTNSLLKRESFNLNRKKILREIRQPLREIQELPKTTKLKGYRPNFKGKFSPQNTPDVTASKISDDIVSAKNASRQVWTAKDKFWKGYETTERMNIIYDNLGHGSQYFDRIVGENLRQKNKKSREVQEHLNMLAHQKAMREVYGIKEYENFIDESETFDNKINDPLFTKVAKRLKKEIDYPMKPAAKGYPNEAPPKVDPNTGYHPKFGKRYKYDKLDPISAKTMTGALTGDPEIDANVKRQAQKEDWRSDLKNLWLGSERKDWKKKIEEDFVNTTQGMKVGQTFVDGGLTVTTSGGLGGVESTPKTVTLDLGLDGKFTVDAPSYNQYGLQGFAKPIDIMRRGKKKTEELNKELDSSEEYTQEIEADEFMKGRVDDYVDTPIDKIEIKYTKLKHNIYRKYFDDLKKVPSINATLGSVGNAYGMGGQLAKSVSEKGLGMTKPYVTALTKLTGEQKENYTKLSQKLQKEKIELRSKKYSQSEINEILRFQIRDVEIEKNKLESMQQDLIDIEKSIDIIRSDYEKLRAERDKAVSEVEKNKEKAKTEFIKDQEKGESTNISRTIKAAETLIRYLTNKLPEGKWNDYLGKGYVDYAIKNGTLMLNGGVSVGDNVIGSAGSMTFDSQTGKYRINFKGLGVDDNITQFTKAEYSAFQKAVLNYLGPFTADLVPTGPDWTRALRLAVAKQASDVLLFAKSFGGGKDVDAFIEISPKEMLSKNPQLAKDYIQQKFGLTGEIWNPRMMGSPQGSDPSVTHNYFALYGKLPPYSVVAGSTPYNIGDHPEYDPAVIAKIKSMRGSSSRDISGSTSKDISTQTDRTGFGYDTKGRLDSSGYGMDPNRDTETEARPIVKPTNQGTFDKDGNFIPPGYQDAIRTDQIKNRSKTVNKIKGLAGEKARKELSLDQPITSPKKSKKKKS